ncbi:MAG: methanogenesis marker 6 protein [Methanobacterium sp.]|uniref:methanogenesis marker 6 protein n=1 Tax=Methanobacterium sp. TaxID=2164 RepID=UPI003D662DB8|nr:methanogenesis marker 6 protein [Methanobacterium sp.]
MSPKTENSEVTRMIILGPSSNINPAELVQKLHMLELPLTIKSTCYGAIIHGDEDVVMDAVKRIRELDPFNIFTKDRGFPPGDPRRCRAKRGAAREGFHQLEKEYELLDCLREAFEHPRKVHVEKPKQISPDLFKKIIKEAEK